MFVQISKTELLNSDNVVRAIFVEATRDKPSSMILLLKTADGLLEIEVKDGFENSVWSQLRG